MNWRLIIENWLLAIVATGHETLPPFDPMNTPETNPPGAPELLDLALSQIGEVLKNSGKERLADLAAKDDGYAQIIWLLEKVSKASLDWRTHRTTEAGPTPGTSATSEQQLKEKLEGIA